MHLDLSKCNLIQIHLNKYNKMQTAQQAAHKRGGKILQYNRRKKCLWQCKEGHTFWLTVHKVHRRGQWCKRCGCSKGERSVRDVLNYYQVPFQAQYSISLLPTRKYDFYFEWRGKHYLVEYDGEQHFHYVRKYHRGKGQLQKSRVADRVKTYLAVQSGYCLIRIDYTQQEYIQWHLVNAVNLAWPVYYSNPEMYKYISQVPLQWCQLIELAPNVAKFYS